MSPRLVILCAVVAVALLGGAAAAFVLSNSTSARAPSTQSANVIESCSPTVKTAHEPVQPHSATPSDATPTKTDKSAASGDASAAKLLAKIDESLRKLVEKQSEVFDATQELASQTMPGRGSRRRGSPAEQPPQVNTEVLKGVVVAQSEVEELAGKTQATIKAGKFLELAADMEQVLRLLAAIMGNLTAREPDVSQLTLSMQQGVVGKLDKMRKGLEAARLPKMEVQDIPAPAEGHSGPVIVGADKTAATSGDRNVTDIRIENGAKLTLGKGTLTVSGDFNNAGTLESGATSLVMNGGNQTFSGAASFNRARFSGGTKHFTAGSSLTTTYSENSDKDNPVLVVEAGCTLVVDKDAAINVPNAYGLRVEGTVIIDGGTLSCAYTHGIGVEGMNASWVKGSQLIIRSGSFSCNGDASFDGVSVYLQGGELRCNDDIWGSGDLLEISGGVMSNATHGGQFGFTGTVRMTGGRLEINQYEGRGFVVGKDCDFWCTSGEIVLGGQDISNATSGIVLARNIQLPTLKVTVSTRISTSTPEGTTLNVAGTITISKGKKLMAQGRMVLGSVETGENFGVLEP